MASTIARASPAGHRQNAIPRRTRLASGGRWLALVRLSPDDAAVVRVVGNIIRAERGDRSFPRARSAYSQTVPLFPVGNLRGVLPRRVLAFSSAWRAFRFDDARPNRLLYAAITLETALGRERDFEWRPESHFAAALRRDLGRAPGSIPHLCGLHRRTSGRVSVSAGLAARP